MSYTRELGKNIYNAFTSLSKGINHQREVYQLSRRGEMR